MQQQQLVLFFHFLILSWFYQEIISNNCSTFAFTTLLLLLLFLYVWGLTGSWLSLRKRWFAFCFVFYCCCLASWLSTPAPSSCTQSPSLLVYLSSPQQLYGQAMHTIMHSTVNSNLNVIQALLNVWRCYATYIYTYNGQVSTSEASYVESLLHTLQTSVFSSLKSTSAMSYLANAMSTSLQ